MKKKNEPTRKRARNNNGASSLPPAKRQRRTTQLQRRTEEMFNAIARNHEARLPATLKNMPHNVLTRIASELKSPANVARFATVNKKVTGNVARAALAKAKSRANAAITQEYQEIVDFFKPWLERFRAANDDVVAYMTRVPGLTLEQYAEYTMSRYEAHLRGPENRAMNGGIHFDAIPYHGEVIAECVLGKIARPPFTHMSIELEVRFEPLRGKTHWGNTIHFHTPNFRPFVVIEQAAGRPGTKSHVLDDAILVEQFLGSGARVAVALNKTANIMRPGFYVQRYSIAGEPWWRHLRGNPYDRVPPSEAYPMKALHHVLFHLFGRDKGLAYKQAMRIFATKGQFEAQFSIQDKTAHTYVHNNRIKTILQHRDPQILTDADVRALQQNQNNAIKAILQQRLNKNAREGSGNVLRRLVFKGP
jgi:hypothetical protein